MPKPKRTRPDGSDKDLVLSPHQAQIHPIQIQIPTRVLVQAQVPEDAVTSEAEDAVGAILHLLAQNPRVLGQCHLAGGAGIEHWSVITCMDGVPCRLAR